MLLIKAELLGLLNSKDEALECYDELLSWDVLKGDKLVIALLKKSKLLFENNDIEKMLSVCNDILVIDGNNLEALTGKSHGLYGSKEYQKCLDCCNKILEIDENDIDGLNIASQASVMLEDDSKALEYCNKVLRIDENNGMALHNGAYVLERQKKYPESLDYMNRFIDLNLPGSPIENAKKFRDKLIEIIQSK